MGIAFAAKVSRTGTPGSLEQIFSIPARSNVRP